MMINQGSGVSGIRRQLALALGMACGSSMFLCRLAGVTTAARMYPARARLDRFAHASAKLGVRASFTSAAETISSAGGAMVSTASLQILAAVSRAAFTKARPLGRSTA